MIIQWAISNIWDRRRQYILCVLGEAKSRLGIQKPSLQVKMSNGFAARAISKKTFEIKVNALEMFTFLKIPLEN